MKDGVFVRTEHVSLKTGKHNTFYFIEQNPFGANYAAGSSLFHWTIDEVLYNNDGVVEFRYT
jgi:hypothetical protein